MVRYHVVVGEACNIIDLSQRLSRNSSPPRFPVVAHALFAHRVYRCVVLPLAYFSTMIS